jgi:hypothetical protein
MAAGICFQQVCICRDALHRSASPSVLRVQLIVACDLFSAERPRSGFGDLPIFPINSAALISSVLSFPSRYQTILLSSAHMTLQNMYSYVTRVGLVGARQEDQRFQLMHPAPVRTPPNSGVRTPAGLPNWVIREAVVIP